MSDQTPAPRSAPDFLHELFWGQISSLLGEQLERYQPKMGTVAGTTGAYLMVLPDGSAVPRKMAHVAGRRYSIGDRVIYGPVKGQPVVYGGVLTATGAAEGVIGLADFAPDVNTILSTFSTSIAGLISAVGTDGGNAASSTGLWNVARGASETAATAKTRADTAKTTADAAASAATAADTHAQKVYNDITSVTGIAGTTLATQVGDGEQAHLRLQGNIDPRMDVVCRMVCGNHANCVNSAIAGCNAALTA